MTVETSERGGFRHFAFLYTGADGFLDVAVPFIREASGDGAVLVAVDTERIALLGTALGPNHGVEYVDIRAFGRNPARIIPMWRSFVAEHASPGARLRGIGEPAWASRTRAEMTECHLHEALLNVAFADGPSWDLMCPYDANALGDRITAEALATHPFAQQGDRSHTSASYPGLDAVAAEFERVLPEPPNPGPPYPFSVHLLGEVRHLVAGGAEAAGMPANRVEDLVLAVSEVAGNSILHGGGRGWLRMWEADGSFVCEVRDRGIITDPLVGRANPAHDAEQGRGLWLANQLCDLVQLRSSVDGTEVRLHMHR